jgi:hypothetical protein
MAVGAVLVLVAGLGLWAMLDTGANVERQVPSATGPLTPSALPTASPQDSPMSPQASPAPAPPVASVPAPSAAPPRAGGSARSKSRRTRAIAAAGPLAVTGDRLALSGGAVLATNRKGYTGKAFVTGLDSRGAAAAWGITVPKAGFYRLTVRYSTALGKDQRESERNLDVWANGRSLGQIRMPTTVGWDYWGITWRLVKLNGGRNRIVLSCGVEDRCHVNLDALRLTPTSRPS